MGMAVMAAASIASAIIGAGSAYMQNEQSKKAQGAQEKANLLARQQQERAASKAQQEQNRVSKQNISANSILGGIGTTNPFGSLTGGQGLTIDDDLLNKPTLLGGGK